MLRTKKDVDAHVKSVLGNVRPGRERDLRGLAIAKHYMKVNAYGTAIEYLLSYINVKEDNELAHKFLGQCYQYLNRPEKALESFQNSLKLNSKQSDILEEVCKLFLEEKVLNINKAKYWCDLAEQQKLAHDSVFALRSKLLDSSATSDNPIDEVLQKEIAARPNDVRLRIKLLRNYVTKNHMELAFNYAFDLEKSMNEHFRQSVEWYKAVWEMLINYELYKDAELRWEYWLLVLISLERQVCLGLIAQNANTSDVVNLLFVLDQYLYKLSQGADKLDEQREVLEFCQEHYRGQLLLFMVSLILKRELLQNKNKWKETLRSALPLILLCYQIDLPDKRQAWAKQCGEQDMKFVQLWDRESAFRSAQAGRILFGCISVEKNDKENESIYLNNSDSSFGLGNQDEVLSLVRNICSDKTWRNDVFLMLFTNTQQKTKQATSLFMKSSKCQEPVYEWPNCSAVEEYEEKARDFYSQSLGHQVYLSMCNENLSNVSAKNTFAGLNLTTPNLLFCGANSLNQLDVDSFLYVATISAKRQFTVDKEFYTNFNTSSHKGGARPRMLPYGLISSKLCTEEQAKWWTAAYKLHKNQCKYDNLAELRSRVEHGIEAIRCVNGPKMDIMNVFKLGQVLCARSQGLTEKRKVEKVALEVRVETIFKQGINMMIEQQKGKLEPFVRFFKYANSKSASVERAVNLAAEDAVNYLSARYFKRGAYEEFITDIEGLNLPTATYMQALAYRKLDELSSTSKVLRAKYAECRNECLKKTRELLKDDPDHPISSLVCFKQNASKYHQRPIGGILESPLENIHNNSSTYEDAEEDFLEDDGEVDVHTPTSLNRSRRDTLGSVGRGGGGGAVAAANADSVVSAAAVVEIKNLIMKQNDDIRAIQKLISNTIQPELLLIKPEIVSLNDKIIDIENILKKTRISLSQPPSHDDDTSQVLDDLYMIDDAFQQQQPLQQTQPSIGSFPNSFGYNNSTGMGATNPLMRSIQQSQQQQQQDRYFPGSTAGMHPMLAAYNSPMFTGNPNSINYFSPQNQFMMSQQAVATPGTVPQNILGPRASNFPMNMYGVPSVPIMEAALNFNQGTQNASLKLAPPLAMALQNSTASTGGGVEAAGPAGPISMPPVPSNEAIAASLINPQVVMPAVSAAAAHQIATPQTNNVQNASSIFNKALNNQPVEKGPPANVVITSSDPLPKPIIGGTLNTQQPTLSVTIPPQHIKPSLVPTVPETITTISGLTHSVPTAPAVLANASQNTTAVTTASSAPIGFNFKLTTSNAASVITTSNTSTFKGFGDSSSMMTLTNTSATANNTTSSLFGKSILSAPAATAAAPSPAVSIPAPTFASSTFSFKPQVAQAAAEKAKELNSSNNNPNENSSLNDSSFGVDPEVEYDPRPDFKPIIPLPDEIVVKTGEEDEEVMFCHLAKLYRLRDKDWKERGKGEIKILKNKEGFSRILMRREQTHKICANHKIIPEITLTQVEKESKALIWCALDFADEEVNLEKFFVRFKLAETAMEFKNAFNKAQEEARLLKKEKEQQSINSNSGDTTTTTTATDTKATSKLATFAEGVTKPFSFIKNDEGVGAVTNNFVTSTPSTINKGITKPFDVVSNPPVVSAVTASEPTKVTQTGFGLANFTFGTKLAASPTASSISSTASSSTISTPNKATTTTLSSFANIFSNIGKGATTTPISSPFAISAAGNGAGGDAGSNTTFNTTLFSTPVGKSPGVSSTITSSSMLRTFTQNNGAAGDNNKTSTSDAEDDYEPTAEFKPVIELPELVEVATGEENEIVLFEHRAKLLRFVKETSEWKERGLGNIKLLQHKDNKNKVRLVMRREQVHKLCCNQFIQKDTKFNFAKNSQTALQWAGQDYSEEELCTEMLCVRFKSPEICNQFYSAILDAQAKMTDDNDGNVAEESCSDSSIEEYDYEEKEEDETETQPKGATGGIDLSIKGFGDAFKPKAGDWSCDGCYLTNKADQLYCISCESPKNASVPPKKSENTIINLAPTTKFSFGFNNSATAPVTASSANATTTAAASPKTVSETVVSGLAKGFGDAFKPKPGSWDCQTCYVSNLADNVKCVSCETPRVSGGGVGSSGPAILDTGKFLYQGNEATEKPKFNFGFNTTPSANTFSFGAPAPAATITKSADGAKVNAFGNIAAGAGSQSFSFTPPVGSTSSSLSSENATVKVVETSSTASTTPFSFSLATKTNATEGAGAAFSLDKKDFSFTLKPKSPGVKGQKTPSKINGDGVNDPDAADDGGDDHYEEEENNTYFTPVIPLPDKIEVKTGEEDEEVLFVHRAKLYRMADSEWKERGLGDVKILRHKELGTCRVVMRREQVLKICLNHALTEQIDYKPKDDKSWLFVVHDFSENESRLETFSLRFKNAEIATEFMTAINNALNITSDTSAGAPSTISKNNETTSDIGIENDYVLADLPENDEDDKAKTPLPMYLPKLTLPKSVEKVTPNTSIKSKSPSSLLKPGALTPNRLQATCTSDTNESKSLFGGFQSSGGSGTSLSNSFSFTNALKDIKSMDSNSFGAPSVSGGGFLFGSGAEDKKFGSDLSGSNFTLFGSKTTLGNANQSIFGGTGASIFSSSNNTMTQGSGTGGSIFGGSTISKPSFGAPPIFGGVSKTLFETETKPSAINTAVPANPPLLFSQNSTTTFADIAKKTDSVKQAAKEVAVPSNPFANLGNKFATDNQSPNNAAATSSSSSLGFADLAAKAASSDDFASLAAKADGNGTAKVGFSKLNNTGSPGSFFGLTHQNAFQSFLQPHNNTGSPASGGGKLDSSIKNTSVETSTTEDNEENYDPHYDPIIPLPKEIVVSTGEEEETKLFGERGTLFRFDEKNKEWKERGVGEVKILLHPGKKSYRLLLRREQIHKLVLNIRINSEFVCNPKNANNAKSVFFGAMNFAENPNGDLERLALRFKKEELAEQFRTILLRSLETALKESEQKEEA